MSIQVIYTNHETGATTTLDLQGDPFEVCDKVQRRLFQVLSEEGWKRLQEHRKVEARRAERERKA